MTSSLYLDLCKRIQNNGPIPVSDFMAEAVGIYYRRPHIFGRQGDFITAPEISQIFGELIGLWFAMIWMTSDKPETFCLIECGPGRGTLMQDALRATVKIPGFHDALDLHLIETSPRLRQTQAEALQGYSPTWHADISTLPEGPIYLIANEFVDALPIRQFEYTGTTWQERVLISTDDELSLAPGIITTPPHDLLAPLSSPEKGSVLEHSPATDSFINEISQRIAREGGAALLFDYGYTDPAYGDTLQAMQQHAYTDILTTAGDADLTAHVNFHRIKYLSEKLGCTVYGPITQGDWLSRMGLEARLSSLYQNAKPEQRKTLISGARRLIDPQAMGCLFKTIALCHNEVHQPEGFLK